MLFLAFIIIRKDFLSISAVGNGRRKNKFWVYLKSVDVVCIGSHRADYCDWVLWVVGLIQYGIIVFLFIILSGFSVYFMVG